NASDEVSEAQGDQGWRGFSFVLHVLVPIAGLALLWKQRGIFSKLLLQLDRSCVSVYCPSLSKREKLLKWASGRLPSTWSSQARTLSTGIPELWKDGSLLCTLINSVVPGACPNPHRHWRKPPLHAQALAYKYLGLVPIFTEDELSGEFTTNQEKNFIHYLHKLQEAINNWPTKDDANRNFSSQYVARGMGLYTGEQHRKTVFYVYSDVTTKKRGNVLMYIRGPYGTQGKATISPFHNLKTIPVVNVLQHQLEATKILPFKNDEQKSFLKTISLDFTSLISNPEDKEDNDEIPIQIDMEIDRAKITYIPKNTGIYEINLICDGELLRGSPYNVQVINNTSGKRDSFSADCENVEEKITFTKRKILSKVIDCIDEQICIENDKISRITFDNSRESSGESDNDLIITAVTKKKDEILKTEINCTLENIIEEINSVQDKNTLDPTEAKNKEEYSQKPNALDEIKKIAENLKAEVPQIVDTNKETNDIIVNSRHKLVKNCEEAKTEIVNLLQQEPVDEVDSKNEYNGNMDLPEKKLISKLDINLVESTKYLKNIVNTTNRQEMLGKILPSEFLGKKAKIDEDENNNSAKNSPSKRIKSKIYVEITPKTMKTKPTIDSHDVTSPICPDHIVPEVEKSSLNLLTLSEKRKAFSKQSSVSIPDCCDNFTFSTSENDESSKSRDSTFRELSVLNVLESIRQSRKNSLSDSCSLSTATSLPNMMSFDSGNHEINFKARKDYWERLSSRSSSNVSLANSDYSQNKRKVMANKNFFNKFNMAGLRHNNEKIEEIAKSVDNLTRIKYDSLDADRQYKSVDTSLEDCSIVSIEERKKQLLKNFYEQEAHTPKKLNIKMNFFKKNNKPKNETNDTVFTPISDRIQNFDKQPTIKPKLTNIATKQVTEPVKEESKKPSTKHSIKSQFKRAIKFFKNLEENSKIKSKHNKKRRFSLDSQKKNNHKIKEGGSLKLSNISERFSVNNLYEDVFGNEFGSFKGTPNKIGVANSLASFSRDPEINDLKAQEESNISYNLFVNKSKNKKRKSIKTLFDVNY
ncbi:claspin -like, partial [Asbolus verrucosus]